MHKNLARLGRFSKFSKTLCTLMSLTDFNSDVLEQTVLTSPSLPLLAYAKGSPCLVLKLRLILLSLERDLEQV